MDGPAGDDNTIRPNQLLGLSLPHAPLAESGAAGAPAQSLTVQSVLTQSSLAQPLLTPLGLRSLAQARPDTGASTAAGRVIGTAPTTRAPSGRG